MIFTVFAKPPSSAVNKVIIFILSLDIIVGSKIYWFNKQSPGLLDRMFDRRYRRDGENNILEIDVLCISFPQLMELWMTGYVTKSTAR